jgi:mRNA interferase YafQ
MKSVRQISSFRKDLKRLVRRSYDCSRMWQLVGYLQSDIPAPRQTNPHPLKGRWAGFWELHIESDWLLVYQVEEIEIVLVRTGTHADIFGT